MVSIVDGHFAPLPFKDMLDSGTGRTRVRMVDIESESYKIARAYMARLEPADFNNQDTLAHYAKVVNLSPDQFSSEFQK
jgi:6-phosphofructokinase 1